MLTSGMVTGMYLFFPLAKLKVFLLEKLTTSSLVIQPTLRKIVLLLPSSKTDHFKLRTLLLHWSYLLSELLCSRSVPGSMKVKGRRNERQQAGW